MSSPSQGENLLHGLPKSLSQCFEYRSTNLRQRLSRGVVVEINFGWLHAQVLRRRRDEGQELDPYEIRQVRSQIAKQFRCQGYQVLGNPSGLLRQICHFLWNIKFQWNLGGGRSLRPKDRRHPATEELLDGFDGTFLLYKKNQNRPSSHTILYFMVGKAQVRYSSSAGQKVW